MNRNDEIQWRDNLGRVADWARPAPVRATRPAPRLSGFWIVAILSTACMLAPLAARPVLAEPWAPNLMRAVNGSGFILLDHGDAIGWCDLAGPQTAHGAPRFLLGVERDGARYVSTRDDIDVTWSAVCPE